MRPEFEGFEDWAREKLGFDLSDRATRNWIDTNVANARSQIQQHLIINQIQEFITVNQATERRKPLNIISSEFQLQTKSIKSIISKLYRANISQNRKFPNAPKGGWVTPENMFGRINDLIRSKIVCRHINEPEKIAGHLAAFAAINDIKSSSVSQNREDGYYAHHVYLTLPINLVNRQWEGFEENLSFEIQVTTEMQNMLYELTHVFYDKERNQLSKDKASWRWDYKSARFSASYLSHTLHLIEGLILRLYEDVESGAAVAPAVSPAVHAETLEIVEVVLPNPIELGAVEGDRSRPDDPTTQEKLDADGEGE